MSLLFHTNQGEGSAFLVAETETQQEKRYMTEQKSQFLSRVL